MTRDVTDYVEREVRIAARPETVFAFFTDPVKMIQWKGVDAALDPRPGGTYRVNVTGTNFARGEYLEITPYTRIVFTWGWEEGPLPPGSTTIEVLFIPDGDGTIVRLRHSGLTGEAAQQHAEGWEHFLPRLAIAAEGRDPGPDPWVSPTEETPPSSKRVRGRTKTKEDLEAFNSAAGGWKDVDTDKLVKQIYEDRRRSLRPPQEL